MRRTIPKPICASARISLSSSRSRANSARPRIGRAAISRQSMRPPTWPQSDDRAVEYLARLQQLDRQAPRPNSADSPVESLASLHQLDRKAPPRTPAKNTTSVAATRPVKQQAGANLANAE